LNRRASEPNPRVHLLHAEYLLNQSRTEESISAFTQTLSIDPRNSNAFYGRATAYDKIKDLKRAETDALAAIRESPKRRDAHLLLLRIYQAQKNPEKVQEYLALVEKLGEEENVRQSQDGKMRQALQLWFEKVEPLIREQQCADTIKYCLNILELWPAFPESHFALGICYSQSGQSAQAEASLKKYLSLKPGSADGHAALGILLLQENRNEEAVKHLESAIAIDPSLVEARKALASIYLSTGDSTAAIRVLQSEGKTPELDNEARLLLAESLLQNGKSALALREVNRVLLEDPANQAATRLKQRILSPSK